MSRTDASTLARDEYLRWAELIGSLSPREWTLPTECEPWDVRLLVAHVVGATEANASPLEMARQLRRGRRGLAIAVDPVSAEQVERRRHVDPPVLLARFRSGHGRGDPLACAVVSPTPISRRSVGVRLGGPTEGGAAMYVRIVTFRLWGLTSDEYRRRAQELAPAFRAWPGLHAKIWLADPEHHTSGGVYVFASKADADASRDTEVFRHMRSEPAFADLTIREYTTLAAPTAVTAPEFVGS